MYIGLLWIQLRNLCLYCTVCVSKLTFNVISFFFFCLSSQLKQCRFVSQIQIKCKTQIPHSHFTIFKWYKSGLEGNIKLHQETWWSRTQMVMALLQFVLFSHFISHFLSPIPFYPISQNPSSLPFMSPSFNSPFFSPLLHFTPFPRTHHPSLLCLPHLIPPFSLP